VNAATEKACTEILFVRDDCPETIVTLALGIESSFARKRISSSFAAPSTGGDFSLILRDPSCSPTISEVDERGRTRTLKVIDPFISVHSITYDLTNIFRTTDCSSPIKINTNIAEMSNIPIGGINR